MKNVYVYIDGFNLYYSIKNTPYKWLNLKQLVDTILPGHNIIKVKYFTANVSGRIDPDAPRRQRIYFNALETLPEIEIITGKFLSKNKWKRLVSLPCAGIALTGNDGNNYTLPSQQYTFQNQRTGNHDILSVDPLPTNYTDKTALENRGFNASFMSVVVQNTEEKGSDVNLATHLVNDAWQNVFDMAVVISADTDLLEPINITVQERGKQVIVLGPPGITLISFNGVASNCFHIRGAHLSASQFPDPIQLPNGRTINKPTTW